MPTTLPPILLNAPMVDSRTMRLTSPWLHWFESSYVRQGGQEAATNTELAGGVQDNSDHIGQVEEDHGTAIDTLEGKVTTLEGKVQTLEGKVAELEENVTELQDALTTLETTVAAQETRLAALEAWKTALQAALPAVVSVTALPTLTDAPATADALRDNLTAAWEGVLETNDSGLATAVNAIKDALAL